MGHQGSSVPRHAALPKHFVPFLCSRGQTDITPGTESTSSTSCLLTLAPRFGKGWLQAVPGAEPLSEELAWHLPVGAGVGERQEDKRLPQGHGYGEENTCSNVFDPRQTPRWKSIAAQFV